MSRSNRAWRSPYETSKGGIMQQKASQAFLLCLAVPVLWSSSLLSVFMGKELVDSVSFGVSVPALVAVVEYVGASAALRLMGRYWSPFEAAHEVIASTADRPLPALALLTFLMEVSVLRYAALEFYFGATALSPTILILLGFFATKALSKSQLLLACTTLIAWFTLVYEEKQSGMLRLPGLVAGVLLAYLRIQLGGDVRIDKRTAFGCFVLLILNGEFFRVFSLNTSFWYQLSLLVAVRSVATVAETFIGVSSRRLQQVCFAIQSFLITLAACGYFREPKSLRWVCCVILLVVMHMCCNVNVLRKKQ